MNGNEYAISLIALAGALFGGAGLEFIKRWLAKAKEKDDTAVNLRNELRGDLTELKKELDEVEREVTQWKDRYYDIVEKKLQIQSQLDKARLQLEQNRGGSNE